MTIRSIKYSYISLAAVLLLLAMLLEATAAFAQTYDGLQSEVFRLHILANSDSEVDQSLKRAVRDDIVPLAKELFSTLEVEQQGDETYAEAFANAAEEYLPMLTEQAQRSVYAHGGTDAVAVSVAFTHFPIKQYEDITMPAGDYWALRIVIGKGEGHNWWCVLYPPLCISPFTAEDAFDSSEWTLLTHPEQYRFRLAILEWLKSLKKE